MLVGKVFAQKNFPNFFHSKNRTLPSCGRYILNLKYVEDIVEGGYIGIKEGRIIAL